MSEEKPSFNVLLATPCYGGQMLRGYTQSILNLQRLCDSNGIKLDILTIGNESLITRARNFYVSLMLAKQEYTHLLFVDSDISFNPLNVLRMLMANKDVVAGCYPKKGINWEKVTNMAKEGIVASEFVEPSCYDYAVNIITENDHGTQKVPIQNGFMKVAYAATGFMMIKRGVLEKMAKEYYNLKYVNDVGGYDVHGNKDFFYALFDCVIDPVSKRYLSEDYAFCKRWIGMNGEIWVDLSCNLTHSGTYDFKGCFLKTIERGIKDEQEKLKDQKVQVPQTQASLEDKLKALLAEKNMSVDGNGGSGIKDMLNSQMSSEVKKNVKFAEDVKKDDIKKEVRPTPPEPVQQQPKKEDTKKEEPKKEDLVKEMSLDDRLAALLSKGGSKSKKMSVI
jgi:hypothetical protein